MVQFMSLGSGSSGNCYYMGMNGEGFLIDAGLPLHHIKGGLKREGIDFAGGIKAIIVTHDHADHTNNVGRLSNEFNLPVYAHEAVHKRLRTNRRQESVRIAQNVRFITPGTPFELCGFTITPFEVPHDSVRNVGYRITRAGTEFIFVLLTDVGHITPTITQYASGTRYLVLEANYDREMLRSGSYPAFLKERIAGPLGHLSNTESADFLCSVFHRRMEHVWLCHLSHENNHPELCRKYFDDRLYAEGIRLGKDLALDIFRKDHPSPLFSLSEE